MQPGNFEILSGSSTAARRARLWTLHGSIETPVFLPVGTQGTVKAVTPDELQSVGAELVLANAYHLFLRPGVGAISQCGGLHRFMGWSGGILTDSGGYQVFSLAKLRRLLSNGVEFNSHVDGARVFMGPAEAMAIQRLLGSDIAMAFDECAPYPCSYDYACESVGRTLSWAARCAAEQRAPGQLLFGIVQGGCYPDLRARCAAELRGIEFDGYAIGGVSVGEPEELLQRVVRETAPLLPFDRPRYLMGVGRMNQILDAIACGIDMFDCVMPTRYARNGVAFTRAGRYPVKAAEYKNDPRPIEEGCACYACRVFPRAYVRHLLNVGEILGARLLTLHNLHRYMEFMREIRSALESGTFEELREQCHNTEQKGTES